MIPTEASSASLHVHFFCSSLIDVALEEVSYVFDYGERERGVIGVVVPSFAIWSVVNLEFCTRA